MPLEPGRRLGAYEITGPIGAGGMGEVYKAKDTRLDRTVAVKVLPAELTESAELRQRFEQEARAVSSLNHAHICTLHDVGHEDGIDFLVMEYVEGETLADRLERGPLPWRDAVARASELAGALGAAHRAGIVHRDIKPGNVILTKSGAKLLDFGLAKLAAPKEESPDFSGVTEAKPLTEKGTILGTFQYMSPEQLEGRETDARSDIFALGVVLYQMVTGKRAFSGDSQAALIADIMKGAPPALSVAAADIPPALDRIVATCLEKDPDERWQSALDLERSLRWLMDEPAGELGAAPASSRGRRLLAAIIGAVAGSALLAVVASTLSREPSLGPQFFQIDIGDNEGLDPGVRANVAVSPDGKLIAFNSVRDGVSRLFLRRLDEAEAHKIPDSEGARNPFFSPDSEWLAFITYPMGRKLRKVSVHGGAPQDIADNFLPSGAVWLPDDTIVFADWPAERGMYRVSASGGEVETLRVLDPLTEGLFAVPSALPVGNSVLANLNRPGRSDTVVVSLDTGEHTTLIEDAVQPLFAEGQLFFVRGGALWAAPFDPDQLEVSGSERPLLSGVALRANTSFSFSKTGVLAYVPGVEGPWIVESLAWLERDGSKELASTERNDFEWLRFSPDGTSVALNTEAPGSLGSEIWTMDVATGRMERQTFQDGQNHSPVWTRDSKAVIFASDRDGRESLYVKSVASGGEPTLFLASDNDLDPLDVSPDGRFLLFRESIDLHVYAFDDASRTPFVVSPAREIYATFSRDGRFVAYSSDASGQREIYVEPFPDTSSKTQVTREGGEDPVWSTDGTEIYFLRNRKIFAAKVRLTPRFEVLGETELFDATVDRGRSFDVHPTTGRFIMVDKTIESPPRFINVVTNVFELLER